MSDNQIPTPEPGKISRRTLAAGVAWAVPAVAVASAAPAHAVSGPTTTTTTLPPCVDTLANDSEDWVVDNAQYSDCASCRTHRDVRLWFTVSTNCPHSRVEIRVKSAGGAHSRWCWNGDSANAWVTRTATISGTTVTYPYHRFSASGNGVNDGLYFPAYQTRTGTTGGWTRDSLGNCQADTEGGTNDGMHVNPCSDGPYFEYQIRYDDGDWSQSYYWGNKTLVLPPPGCGSQVAPSNVRVVSNTCQDNNRSITVAWDGDATQYRRRVVGSNWPFQYTSLNNAQQSAGSVTFSVTDRNPSCSREYEIQICNGSLCNSVSTAAALYAGDDAETHDADAAEVTGSSVDAEAGSVEAPAEVDASESLAEEQAESLAQIDEPAVTFEEA